MTASLHASSDTRAFSWGLQPLERKLAWEWDAALAQVARAVSALQEAQQALRSLEQLQDQEAAAAAEASRHGLDPHAHAQALRYLATIGHRVRAAMHQIRSRERAVAQAREEFAVCQRRSDTLSAARVQAMRAYVRAAQLRSDRQADAAWLSHQQHARASSGVSP